MRNITTMMMLRGQVVHEIISGMLRTVRLGLPAEIEEAKASVTDILRARYMESAKRLWHIDNRPKERKISGITNLLEHYYGFPNTEQRVREARLVAWQCVENLMGSQIWAEIVSSDVEKWLEIDEEEGFQSFDLDGIQVYPKIDFSHSCGGPTIIDWKTGNPSEQDRKQLVLYSLYAQSKWEWDPVEVDLAAVYLQPEMRVERFRASTEELESVRDEVRRSFEEMMELEPAFGPAEIEKFPMTDDTKICGWCRFQGACRRKDGSSADE